MAHPNILLWGNNTFHLVDSWNMEDKLIPKYLKIGISGTLEHFTILTYDEIMVMTENQAKPVKSLLEIHEVYHQR